MQLSDYRQVLEQNRQTAMVVRLDGMGEPTLHPDVFEMVRVAKSYGLSVSMHSNLNTRACARVSEFVDSGLDRLVVAVDGATQESYERYRVGGDLNLVLERVEQLVDYRKRRQQRRPIIEFQLIDFDHNRQERPAIRQLVRRLGVDRLEITEADRRTREANQKSQQPKRCFWLWTVLTLGWDLEYRSCANAWSLPWPRLNLRSLPSRELWNHELIRQARQYNLDQESQVIADDEGCKCNRCYEMLVVPLDSPLLPYQNRQYVLGHETKRIEVS